MFSTQGAGQRLRSEFAVGQMAVDQENRFVRNSNEQEFFVTDAGRIMRYDRAVDLYNVYDKKTKEFVPCDGLNAGESIVKHGTKEQLMNSLLAQPGWGDWFCNQGAKFGAACGKQVVFGVATATIGSTLGPVISRTVNRAMDSVGYTAQVAKPALSEPIKTGVQAKAAGLNAIRGHGLAKNVNGLRAASGPVMDCHPHFPRGVPRCPVTDPFFPHGPRVPPWVDPVGPWVPWDTAGWPPVWLRNVAGGLAAGGTTASGAVVGALVGGPVGGVLGGALGAGFGSLFT